MRITSLELNDIKSHQHTGPVAFADGVNAIAGPTGAGKSTLLEAIGFALFDALPYVRRQFVREGATRGEVVVDFEDALDERQYRVVRQAGGSAYYVYDPETKRKIVQGKQDVLDWLKEHLGVDESADLGALFTDAVGVPQGLLTAAFLETPRNRKSKFDPLLQVDDYERAWNGLRDTGSYLRAQLATGEGEQKALEAELTRLPELRREAESLASRLTNDEQTLVEVRARLQMVEVEKDSLDRMRDELRECEQGLARLASELAELQNQQPALEAEVQRSREAVLTVQETESAYTQYEGAKGSMAALRRQHAQRDRLNAQLIEVESKLALADNELSHMQESLQGIAEAEQEIAALAPAVEQQRVLQRDLKEAEKQVSRLEAVRERTGREHEHLQKLDMELDRVRAQLEQLQALETEHKQAERERAELQQSLAAREALQAQLAAQREELCERLRLLGTEALADCPLCLRPLAATDAEQVRRHFCDELDHVEERLKDGEGAIEAAQTQFMSLQSSLEDLAREMRSLPHARRDEELSQEIGKQKAVLRQVDEERETLELAPARLSALVKALDVLGDPLRHSDRLEALVADKRDKESRLSEASADRVRLAEAKDVLDDKLLAFAELEADTAALQRVVDGAERDHARHLEHRKVAEALPRREKQLGELLTRLKASRSGMARLEQDRDRVRAGYDAETHRQLLQEHGRLLAEHARVDERLKADRRLLSRYRSELLALGRTEARVTEIAKKLERLRQLSEALEFIRQVVREAGPYVTRALVLTISRQADLTFGDILNDHTMRLAWGDDYGISVEQAGSQRSFSQLSGGEKAAAALAVRLSLLREMSQIRLAFFDEPTAHLDEARRDNLAAQLTQIRGFRQLFVISHDDAFERETHHVLRVSKVNGISQVEVA